jgi:Putative peptidoglycan binding domain/HlyD family secretion protein
MTAKRRIAVATFAAGTLIVGVLGTAVLVTRRPAASAASKSTHQSTVSVERRDLVETETASGTLGYGPTTDVPSPRAGTITALPSAGSVVERGQSLFEVDDRGVPLFYGARPMWRTLASGADDGPDIQQLEANLVALGYAPEGLEVDNHWDWATTVAVKRWQKALGLDQTGTVSPSDLVFLPGAVRVAQVKAQLGSHAQPGGQPVIQVTGTSRVVTIRLDAAKRDLAHVGDAVQISLPDGTKVNGKVFSVGSVATVDSSQGGDSTAKIDVLVALSDTRAAHAFDGAPVDVDLTRSAAKGVLAVPVRALLALAEGGYAVEVVNSSQSHLVRVELGTFADGWVEVTGALHAGDRVVVASS